MARTASAARSRFHPSSESTAPIKWCEDALVNAKRLALIGWGLFTVSGVFFLIDALESGDKTALGSALTWLAGIVFFVWSAQINETE